MSVLLSPSPGMSFQHNGNPNMSQHDITNDIILRESAYLAEQLLKKLTQVQSAPHHTEVPPVPPVHQSRQETPTAQIPSPLESPMTEKPLSPVFSPTRARMHFNSLLIPQLQDTSHLGKRKSIRPTTANDYSTTTSASSNAELEPAPLSLRTQTWPSTSSKNNRLYSINEESARDASHSQQQYKQPFPRFPSQRLPPLPPRTSETKAAIEAHYRNYRRQNRKHENTPSSRQQQLPPPPPPPKQQQKPLNNPQTNQRCTITTTTTTERGGIILNQRLPSTTSTTTTGKRRIEQGAVIVPVIAPPPPGRGSNISRKGKGKGSSGSGGITIVNRGRGGWEEFNVHGVWAGRPF